MAKKLVWSSTKYGPFPVCVPCSQLMHDPLFVEAVYSVSIDKTGSPDKLMRAAINAYHEQGHKH